MKLNYYYFKEQDKCFLCTFENKPEYDDISKDENVITIDIKSRNVQNLYDFFRKNTLKILADGSGDEFDINDSDIINESFYSTDSFKKLMELIKQSIDKCNDTIRACK